MNVYLEDAEFLRLTLAALERVETAQDLADVVKLAGSSEPVRFIGFSFWRVLAHDRKVDWWASTFPPLFHDLFGTSLSLRRHRIASQNVTRLVPVDWLELFRKLGPDHPEMRTALSLGLTPTGLSCAVRGFGRNFGILYVNFDVSEAEWEQRSLSLSACVQLIAIYLHQKLIELRPDLGMPIVLSNRERACIALAAEGKKVKQIAFTLGISEQTVNFYLGRARVKLGVTNTTHAAVVATEMGLFGDEETASQG